MTDLPAPSGYHDFPLLKKPVWTWEIPAYFFVGGVAGAVRTHRRGGSADRRQ